MRTWIKTYMLYIYMYNPEHRTRALRYAPSLRAQHTCVLLTMLTIYVRIFECASQEQSIARFFCAYPLVLVRGGALARHDLRTCLYEYFMSTSIQV